MTFRLWRCLNVTSKRLHKRMQTHTGCIYLAFLQCVSSNVPSIRLYEKMHSHTVCICFACVVCLCLNFYLGQYLPLYHQQDFDPTLQERWMFDLSTSDFPQALILSN